MLYLWTDETETFIAENIEDLEKVITAHYGNTYEDATGDESVEDCFVRIDSEAIQSVFWNSKEDKSLDRLNSISVEDATGNAPNSDWDVLVKAKAKDWAEWHGKGFLCSTEY